MNESTYLYNSYTINNFIAISCDYDHDFIFTTTIVILIIIDDLQGADENDSVETVEKKLCQLFDSNYWHRLHHLFIFFGRYKCKSRNPECNDCPFTNMCNYYQKTFSAK